MIEMMIAYHRRSGSGSVSAASLLILEMLGTGGYLLWSGVAATVCRASVVDYAGLSLEWQVLSSR